VAALTAGAVTLASRLFDRLTVPAVAKSALSSRIRLAGSPLRWLTPRELDVLREMARGRANPGIAAALVLSESAVEKHVSSIFAKLGLGPEPTQDRRVTAVLTFLRDAPQPCQSSGKVVLQFMIVQNGRLGRRAW
jgi:DNA-binding NarL/FixJ family response regulator